MCKKLIVDTETAGDEQQSIVAVSAIYTVDNIIVETYTATVRSPYQSTAKAYMIHGIADYMRSAMPCTIATKLETYARNADMFVAHNAEFDKMVLYNMGFPDLTKAIQGLKTFDTMRDATSLWKEVYSGTTAYNKSVHYAYNSLKDCIAYLINNDYYTEQEILEGVRKAFPDSTCMHHDSTFDVYACYLVEKVLNVC